jgi:hypothetical protein
LVADLDLGLVAARVFVFSCSFGSGISGLLDFGWIFDGNALSHIFDGFDIEALHFWLDALTLDLDVGLAIDQVIVVAVILLPRSGGTVLLLLDSHPFEFLPLLLALALEVGFNFFPFGR